MSPDPIRDCKHGRLKRKCPECAWEEDWAEATKAMRLAKDFIDNLVAWNEPPAFDKALKVIKALEEAMQR